ncbi:hypothetical protein DGG96_05580 [Legionella qingyii]|uniref:Phytanoyl-CoA dioxygenase n=1 Tax=Legionella qingyii TaxID=2184757 RepID=A0A317U5R6_9GAMM|nr:phytanoyl-CoA dioxygenase family protein [Legionella qingyii]PWY56595.1 hypothetical protein DGG96_05580 [Legionella qingyii]RUR23408.1 hypothetical protein ELY20_07310 [Legionella qingyii]RUR26145.1 hypothetical protein ELY16_08365 [Legionella qingyii]
MSIDIKRTAFFHSFALIFAHSIAKIGKNPFSEKALVGEIRENGYAVLDSFLPADICDRLITIFNSLESTAQIIDNDRRIFSIQKMSADHRHLFSDSAFLKIIGEQYIKTPQLLTTTMAAKIYSDAKAFGSGGGWHRDSFLSQFKAICYLSDVSELNGPFEYITGSHKLRNKILFELRSKTRKHANNPRYDQENIDEYLQIMDVSPKVFLAPKGTVILCDTSGLHRGQPIIDGVRYAITNYYASSRRFLDKNIKKNQIQYTNMN